MKVIQKKKTVIGIFFIFIQGILNSLFIPVQEFPDAYHHLTKILENSKFNVYYSIQNFFLVHNIKLKKLELNKLYSQGGNQSIYIYKEYEISEFLSSQIVNLIILGLIVLVLVLVISNDKEIELNKKKELITIMILFFSWPQINYYLITLSSDFLVILYQPLFLYFILKNKILINFISMFYLLKFVDNNIFTNIIFSLVYYSIMIIFTYKKKMKITKKKLILISILGLAIVYFLVNSSLLEVYFPNVYKHKEFNYSVGSGSWLRRIGALFLSSFYLSGSMAYTLPYLLYGVYFAILFKIGLRLILEKEDESLFIFFLTSVITIGITMIIIPTLGHLRYYTFLILFIIEGIKKHTFKDKNLNMKRYVYFLVFNLSVTLYMNLKIVLNIYK